MFPLISGKVFDATGTFTLAYVIAGACLVAAALIVLVAKPPAAKRAVEVAGKLAGEKAAVGTGK